MLLASFAEYVQRGQTVTRRIVESRISPLDKIKRIIVENLEVYGQDPEVARVFFDFWTEGMQNKEQPEIDFRPIYADYRRLLQRLLERARFAGQVRQDISIHTASIIIGVLEGIFLQWLVDPEAFSLPDTISGIIDTLLFGIKS